MAIPLILGAAAVVSAISGGAKMMSANDKKKEAKRIADYAETRHQEALEEFKELTNETNTKLEEMGKIKLEISENTIGRFVSIYKKLGKIKKQEELDREDLSLDISPEEIKTWEQESIKAGQILSGGAEALSAGAATAIGVYGTTMVLGTASTGTAIASLSGAAATNATLAALGGGSLAAGGFGMAGGAAVLGGLVAGPAILVTGWMMDSAAEKALTNAKDYEAKVEIAIEEINCKMELLRATQLRAAEFVTVLRGFQERLNPLLNTLEGYIQKKNLMQYLAISIGLPVLGFIINLSFLGWILIVGFEYLLHKFWPRKPLTESQESYLITVVILAKTLKTILAEPLLSKDGQMNPKAETVLHNASTLLMSH